VRLGAEKPGAQSVGLQRGVGAAHSKSPTEAHAFFVPWAWAQGVGFLELNFY